MNPWKKVNLSLRSSETGNLSADNFKKIFDFDGLTLEPAVRSGDTGQRMPCFDSCQLITKFFFFFLIDYNIDVQLVFSWAPKLAKKVKVNIGFPVVRTDGRTVGRSRDYQIFWDG